MTRIVGTPLQSVEFNAAGDEAVSARVSSDNHPRIRIDAGGRITWSSGSAAGDTTLYRDAADVLKTDDTFKVPALFIDGIEVDTTGATTNQILKYNGTKFLPAADGGGGGSYIISATAPVSPSVSDVWFNSDNGRTYIYYNDGNTTQWVEFGNANSGPTGATGVGVATGGTIGQVLAKNSSTNYDTTWASVGSAARPLLTGGAYLSGSGLVLGGLASNNASTPDSSPLDITGDIDIAARMSVPNWLTAPQSSLVAKEATSFSRSYRFMINGSGALGLTLSADGTAQSTVAVSSAAVSFTVGQVGWVRATWRASDGRVQFFTAADSATYPSSWTQLGTDQTGHVGAIFNSAASLEVGSRWSGASMLLNGTVYRAIVKKGIDGIVVFDSDFSTQTADALAFNATSDAGIKADGLVLKGVTGQYASAPDSAALSITGDIDIQVKVTLPDWTPAGTTYIFAAKRVDGGNQQSFSFYLSATGILNLSTSPNGTGPSLVTSSSTVATGVADGATKWVRATLDVNDGAGNRVAKFYTSDNGTTWTQLGTTVTTAGTTSIFDSNSPLEIGSRNLGVNDKLIGTVHRVIIRNSYDGSSAGTIVFDSNFDAQVPETTSFTARGEAGIKEDGLVLKGDSFHYATIPDSAALSITGDIDIKTKLTMASWTPASSTGFIVSKWGGGTSRSYYLAITNTGLIVFNSTPTGIYTDGIGVVSTAATGFTAGATKWIRATLDVDNGSSQRVLKYYTSDDGTTWTQLGTTITTAGTTSIFDGIDRLTIGTTDANLTPMIGTVHRVIIQSAYDTANNTSSLAFDADFDAQTPETTSFIESSSNAATVTILAVSPATVTMNLTNPTVTINTTRYSYGIPNAQSGAISTGNLTSGNDRYQRFVVTRPTVVDMVLMQVTTGPASAATVYFGLYAADSNWQPTGNVLLATDIAVGTSATGVFTKQVTPVTLQAGTYLFATNPSVTMTVRTLVNGDNAIASTYGASGAIVVISRGRTAGTFGNNPSAWNTTATGSSVGSINYALLRYKAAS